MVCAALCLHGFCLLHCRLCGELTGAWQQRRSEAYADTYGIPSTYVCTMMSWLRKEPMAEHVAVEFWSGSGLPLKCLRTLPLQFLKSLDG